VDDNIVKNFSQLICVLFGGGAHGRWKKFIKSDFDEKQIIDGEKGSNKHRRNFSSTNARTRLHTNKYVPTHQGCQIFLDLINQNGEKIPNGHKI
jgi:hypothetical protein